MTPERLAEIQALYIYDIGGDETIRELADALEEAWAERDAYGDNWVRNHGRAEKAEATLARVQKLRNQYSIGPVCRGCQDFWPELASILDQGTNSD